MTFNPDKKSAEIAMRNVPEDDRKFYQGLYVKEGEFVGIYCRTCYREYGDGHDDYCVELGVR